MTDAADPKDPKDHSTARTAWEDVAGEFSGLGLKLKLHLQQARGEEASGEVRDALDKLASAIDDAFEAVGTAAKDPALRDDVRSVGRSLSSALGATFAEVSDDLSRLFDRKQRPKA
jgi:hypothetical protein